MPLGPGRYGARAEALMREVGGDLCVIITLHGGADRSAFDVATSNPELLRALPRILREVATLMEQDLQQQTQH